MKEGDVVLVKPWVVEGDKRGDIVNVYSKGEVEILKKLGLWE
jgi:initiation factor 1A